MGTLQYHWVESSCQHGILSKTVNTFCKSCTERGPRISERGHASERKIAESTFWTFESQCQKPRLCRLICPRWVVASISEKGRHRRDRWCGSKQFQTQNWNLAQWSPTHHHSEILEEIRSHYVWKKVLKPLANWLCTLGNYKCYETTFRMWRSCPMILKFKLYYKINCFAIFLHETSLGTIFSQRKPRRPGPPRVAKAQHHPT